MTTIEAFKFQIPKAIDIIREVFPGFVAPMITGVELCSQKTDWAMICYEGSNRYSIKLSSLFDMIPSETARDKRILETCIHELIHTMRGCWDHKQRFKMVANSIMSKHSDLKIYGVSCSDTGIDYIPKMKYRIVCQNCGAYYLMERRIKGYRELNDRYVCKKCNTSNLVLETINKEGD